MPTIRRRIVILFLCLVPSWTVLAQSALTISSASAPSGTAISLNLSLTSPVGVSVAALQWTVAYPVTLSDVSFTAGPALAAAGKTLACTAAAGGYTCLAYGMNANAIADGTVATLSGTFSGSSNITIVLSGTLGTTPDGSAVSINGTSGSITLSATLRSVSCVPSSLSPGGASTCTVTLNGPAPSAGSVVAITTTGSVAAPASVLIPAGASTGTLAITTGSFTTDQTATISGALNGSSAGATLSLVAPPLVSSVQCAPPALLSNAITTCTVTLTKAATGDAIVSISGAIANVLAVPASVAVPSGSSAATFAVTTGSIPSDQTVTITASLNGSSAGASVALSAPLLISVFQCTPSSLGPNSSANCSVVLSKPAPAGVTISISNGSPGLLSTPSSFPVPANATTASFSASTTAVPSAQAVILTASYQTSSAITTLTVTTGVSPTLTSLICSPLSVQPGFSGTCAIKLSAPVISDTAITLKSSNAGLSVPASATVAAGSSSTSFTFTTSTTLSGWLMIVATLGSSSRSVLLTIASPTTTLSLRCPGYAVDGSNVCEVGLNPPPPAALALRVQTSPSGIAVPALVRVRAGQRTVRFRVLIGPESPPEAIELTVVSGDAAASAFLIGAKSDGRFDVTASDALSHGSARFSGGYTGNRVPESAGLANVAGAPAIAACTPGSVAALTGRFLAESGEAIIDRSGRATELNGTAVQVNGRTVPVLLAAADRVEFLCPKDPPGTVLDIAVSRGSAISNPIRTKMETDAPGIITVDPDDAQAFAFHPDSGDIVAIANPRFTASAAFPGDPVSLLVTGIDCDDNFRSGRPQIEVAGHLVFPSAISPAAWHTGACEMTFTVPPGIDDDRAPLRLQVVRYDGGVHTSNPVTIAVQNHF